METKSCTTCIHMEVCAMCIPFTPACADYMEVVRCKDCKWFICDMISGETACVNQNGPVRTISNGFCSFGELKPCICPCCDTEIPEDTQVCPNCLCAIKEVDAND